MRGIFYLLFRQNGFTVADTGYFVYCNDTTDRETLDGRLELDISMLAIQRGLYSASIARIARQ